MKKHTPGPWIIINNNICYDSDYGGPFKSIAENVTNHNLNLIKNAPEMFEELAQIREALNDGVLSSGSKTMDDEMIYNINKILKNAKG